MRTAFAIAVAAFGTAAAAALTPTKQIPERQHYAVLPGDGDTFDVVPAANVSAADASRVAANAWHSETLMTTGWDFLKIQAAGTAAGYEAAGFAEGFLTYDAMLAYGAYNRYNRTTEASRAWIQGNIKYMKDAWTKVPVDHASYLPAKYRGSKKMATKFWRQAALFWAQMTGMVKGFNAKAEVAGSHETIDLNDLLALQMLDELADINEKGSHAPWDAAKHEGHCSALVKVTADDLFVAHDTWNSFQSMRRVYKQYLFGDVAVGFSAYPGLIASGDDWYVTSSGLAVQETTNEVFNKTLYRDYIKSDTVAEYLRTIIATYAAEDAEQWAVLFGMFNSGTYNNQYMAVDMKKFSPGKALPDGLLWVAEQIPGHVEMHDMTDTLRKTSYWASFNVPAFPYIYNVSGYEQRLEEDGPFWSHTKYARPEIFRRQQATVKDLASMQAIMRFNEYKTDKFSVIPNENDECINCTYPSGMSNRTNGTCYPPRSSMLTIASRGDLMPAANVDKGVCYGDKISAFIGKRDHAATDTKIAQWSTMHRTGVLGGVIISGPTAQGDAPVFSFSRSTVPRPAGMPDRYDFPWFAVDAGRRRPHGGGDAAPRSAAPVLIFSISTVVLVVLIIALGNKVMRACGLTQCLVNTKMPTADEGTPEEPLLAEKASVNV